MAYNSPLSEVSCHDDDVGIVLPHHSPEVLSSGFHRSLRRYVLPWGSLVTLPITSLISHMLRTPLITLTLI